MSSFEEYIYDTVDMLIYSGTENFVSALCASIPVIRPLWSFLIHGYVSRDGSYPNKPSYQLSDMDRSNGRSTGGGLSGNRAGPETRIYADAFEQGGSDNNSEEMILHDKKGGVMHAKRDDRGITCQTEISVNSAVDSRRN